LQKDGQFAKARDVAQEMKSKIAADWFPNNDYESIRNL
jgi:hypothetical protein